MRKLKVKISAVPKRGSTDLEQARLLLIQMVSMEINPNENIRYRNRVVRWLNKFGKG
jgi:hypothetical protein